MTKDEHERERRAFWDACCAEAEHDWDPSIGASKAACCAAIADEKLAERDKRWPAPEEPVKAGVDPETEQAGNCDTCKFSALGPFREPCRSCRVVTLATASHWEQAK